eukprot:11394000-Alexandrium_andersonii.AAC.1
MLRRKLWAPRPADPTLHGRVRCANAPPRRERMRAARRAPAVKKRRARAPSGGARVRGASYH